MNFFYGNTKDVHTNGHDDRVSRASNFEVAEPVKPAPQPKSTPQPSASPISPTKPTPDKVVAQSPNPLTDPQVIDKMNNLHCLSLFLTSRVGASVRVIMADGMQIEGILRNVGSDYCVVANEINNTVCPFTALNCIKM